MAALRARPADRINNVVLVHGGFVDGSGWEPVYKLLTGKGYNVSVVQNPTISLAKDVAATKAVLDAQTGPVILVGHSYGGAVITEAGNDPKVSRLVYIAAFAPDKGESCRLAHRQSCAGSPRATSIVGPVNGFLLLETRRKIRRVIREQICRQSAQHSSPHRRSRGVSMHLSGSITNAAWRSKPSWYLVAKDDKMIPVPARSLWQRLQAPVQELLAPRQTQEPG